MLGIRAKILTISVSVVVLGVGVSTFLSGRAFRKEYSDSLYSEVKVIAQDLRAQLDRILSLGLTVDDIKGFEKQCQDVTREYPKLAYAAVVRSDGTILFHSTPALQGTPLRHREWLASVAHGQTAVHTWRDENQEELSHVAVPSQSDGYAGIFVVVGYPAKLVDAKVRDLVVKSMLFMGGSIALAAVVLLAIVTASVTRPLSLLVGTIREIRSSGDLSKKVAVRSKDEFGTLASSFNEMLTSLRRARDELEDRVAERTKELTKANQDLKQEIAERSRVEQALRESEDRYRLVAERTGQVIYDHDVATGRVQWAGAVEKVTGYGLQEFSQFDIGAWEELIHPEDRAMVTEAMEQVFKHGTTYESPYRFRRKDGHYLYIEDSAVLLRSPQGDPVRMLGAMKDITQRRLAEDELKRSHELLEQRVEERTREVVQANQQIRQAQADLVQAEKMGMLGQLVAGVAHEVNTPTGAIMNVANDTAMHLRELAAAGLKMCQLPQDLRDWLAEEVPKILGRKPIFAELTDRHVRAEMEEALRKGGAANARRIAEVLIDCGLTSSDRNAVKCLSQEAGMNFLERVVALKVGSDITLTSVQKITKIVKALRYYSRTGEGEVFDINLNESLDNTLIILQNRIKHVAKVERNYQDDILPVRCGPDISQVWTNVLSNACDAIEGSGGGGLIRVTTRMAEGQAVVEIYNAGPPIPEEIIAKIFDPFFTTKPIGKGTGLGLSICTGILRKYRGTIVARNEPDGVTFQVTVPLGQPGQPGAQDQGQGAEQLAQRAS